MTAPALPCPSSTGQTRQPQQPKSIPRSCWQGLRTIPTPTRSGIQAGASCQRPTAVASASASQRLLEPHPRPRTDIKREPPGTYKKPQLSHLGTIATSPRNSASNNPRPPSNSPFLPALDRGGHRAQPEPLLPHLPNHSPSRRRTPSPKHQSQQHPADGVRDDLAFLTGPRQPTRQHSTQRGGAGRGHDRVDGREEAVTSSASELVGRAVHLVQGWDGGFSRGRRHGESECVDGLHTEESVLCTWHTCR